MARMGAGPGGGVEGAGGDDVGRGGGVGGRGGSMTGEATERTTTWRVEGERLGELACGRRYGTRRNSFRLQRNHLVIVRRFVADLVSSFRCSGDILRR
jgi:hypothetical protein